MIAPQPSVFDGLTSDDDRLDGRLLGELVDRVATLQGRDVSANGVNVLIDDFKKGGFESYVYSWLAPGQSAAPDPMPPEVLDKVSQEGQVISTDWLAHVAVDTGLSRPEVTRRFSVLVPVVVKALMPRGTVPSRAAVQIGLDALKRRAAR